METSSPRSDELLVAGEKTPPLCVRPTCRQVIKYTILGTLQLFCYALPYFLTVWHVVEKYTGEATVNNQQGYMYGWDVTAESFRNILGGVFAGLVLVSLVIYVLVTVLSRRHARRWWRPSITLYVLFCSTPVMLLLGLAFKVHAKKIPCSILKVYDAQNTTSNTTSACTLGSSPSSLIQAAEFDHFDEWSIFILQVVLMCLVVNEWFAKFKEIKHDDDITSIYSIIKECGMEFFPLYDIAEFQSLLTNASIFSEDPLTVTIMVFTVISTLKFAPSPPKDEFDRHKLMFENSRLHSALYYTMMLVFQDIPYLVVRIYIMVTYRNGMTLSELLFTFKNAGYIAWYSLLLILLMVSAEKLDKDAQRYVMSVLRENKGNLWGNHLTHPKPKRRKKKPKVPKQVEGTLTGSKENMRVKKRVKTPRKADHEETLHVSDEAASPAVKRKRKKKRVSSVTPEPPLSLTV
ncbi:uncharacterized protein LOC106167758 [Lingula anatina]|uniref:Uncharacterized protein LOC106167758 n=1 Tax=Lingula anatina TaxID=7574 RepID=A0A1S3IVI4_LINAN|nr:uncharacterized protein LOC106167758 [Lingula anatina]|eukprot:XP_013402073.1 uncharacterized protein LOC106167758 [Lingula anatina]